jgi:hypothetical protein
MGLLAGHERPSFGVRRLDAALDGGRPSCKAASDFGVRRLDAALDGGLPTIQSGIQPPHAKKIGIPLSYR